MTLTRGAHPLARPEYDAGRLDPNKVVHNLSLVFKLSPEQKAERDALLAELQRPGSPSYHHWLTPEEYAARFGARPEDIARATSWLASQGFTVHEPSRLGARVTFTGTVAQLETAFATEMHAYAVDGEMHYAMARPPSVPADLADHILAVTNTHDFYPRQPTPQFRIREPAAACPVGDTYCTGNGIAPPDWSVLYDVGPLYSTGVKGTKIDGTGVTIAIVGITEISQTDLTAFRTRYGLAGNPITMTVVPNTGAAQADNGAGLEAVLDTEWAGAIAPNAKIQYVYTGASDANVSDAVYYAIEQNYGGILSESWGGCEQGTTTSDADVLEVYGSIAALEGISYLASSGDSGAAGCQGKGGLWVNMPASLPEVTAVGGTGFSYPGGLTVNAQGGVTSRNPGPEAVWNEANDAYTGNVAAGGGGISSVFKRPGYQSAIPTCKPVGSLPSTVTAANQRQVPDVSFTAAAGTSQYGIFIECTIDPLAGDCTNTGASPKVVEIGGTSASTPSFAGVVALANQATGGRLGNLNPMLYALDALNQTPSVFHDVTTGNNEVVCRTTDPGCPGNNQLYGFAAATGYDCASGLGSVDATNLVNALVTLTPTTASLSAAPTATTEGGSVTLGATVDVQGTTNTNALKGTVTFTFQSYLSNGDPDLSWTLGEVPITGGTTSGTATLTTAIPPGMVQPSQAVDLYARYSGDATHLPSVSPKQHITFSPVYLCINPPTASVAAGGKLTYTAAGGVSPVRWYLDYDSTCNAQGTGCSSVNVTTGAFTAGTGQAGYVIVQAVDADGAETFGEVTVGGGGGQMVPWSTSGPSNYAGIRVSGTPLTTCPAGDDCGTIPNGCGGTVNCGTCTAPQTCGGGGATNVCGCTPLTKCPAGDNCGAVSNGCGGTVNCGTCTAPQTCGGGGAANVCGCTPTTCAAQGASCGVIADQCGGMLTCGSCPGGDSCVHNVCVSGGPDGGASDGGTTSQDGGAGDGGVSGMDAGAHDAGAPDGGAQDAGAADGGFADASAPDAGPSEDAGDDAGGETDSGGSDDGATVDAATGDDAGGGTADAAGDAAADGSVDAGGGSSGGGGGCGCRVVQSSSTSTSNLAGIGGLLLLAGVRARRRKK